MKWDMTAGHLAGVSEREAEVLAALGEHLSNAQIANRLHISVRTVESHVSSLLRKFGVDDRKALAELAPTTSPAGTGELAGQPVAWTTFVGRGREAAAVLAALSEGRLVSLVGPGGVGKTRLAVAVAEQASRLFARGGAFVDLVPVREGFVAQAVAAVLGVTEHPQQPLDDVVIEELRRGQSLLVLDNCEHLLDAAAAFVERLLASCPGLTVLTTSRERLGVPGERTIRVPPLSLVSADTGGPTGSEAEALFLDRATAADPEFADYRVGRLCARLDGMPLAIELAAARIASLGMDGLLAGLVDPVQLLAGGRGADHRHRSLRDVIDWSHDLLDDAERALFRRLGVFAGGFDLDGAVAVTPDGDRGTIADLIGRLADKSLLVHRSTGGQSHWRLLETVRAYALSTLDASGEEPDTRLRHLSWAASTAEELETRITAGKAWRDDFDAVADDLRAAFGGAAPGPGSENVAHKLGRALGHLSYARGFMVESGLHYRETATRAPRDTDAIADLRMAADVALANMRGDEAFNLLVRAASRADTAGDRAARAVALAFAVTIADRAPADFPEEIPHERLRALLATARDIAPAEDPEVTAYLTAAAAWNSTGLKITPDHDLSAAALAAARAIDDPALISGALDAVTCTLGRAGRMRAAFELNAERVTLLDRLPRHDPRAGFEITDIFHMANEFALMAGELPTATANARRVQLEAVMLGQPHNSASQLVLPLVLQGQFDEALDHADTMWHSWQRAGQPAARWMSPSVYATALAHGLRGAEPAYRTWCANAGRVIGGPNPTTHRNLHMFSVFADARVAMHLGHLDHAAARTANVCNPDWYAESHWYYDAYAWAIAAEVAVLADLPDAADRLAAAQPVAEENAWAAACLDRALGRLGDQSALARAVTRWERLEARFERACTLLLIPDRAAEGHTELATLGCPPPANGT